MTNICNRCKKDCKTSDKVLCAGFKSVDDHGHKAEDRAFAEKIVQDALIKRAYKGQ